MGTGVRRRQERAHGHRAAALLESPVTEPTASRWAVPAALAAVVVLAPVLHHATETVLSLLARP